VDGLGIDLGTSKTVVCHPHRGVVFEEPSIMALRTTNRRRSQLVWVGSQARVLLGRRPVGLALVRPLSDGVVADLELTRRLVRAALDGAGVRRWQRRFLSVVIAVPAGATALERRAVLEAAEEAGVGRAALIPGPVAGAVGCGLDPLEPRTRMVVDVGGGTSEVAAFSFGGMLAFRSCPLAGDEMTLAVYQHLRDKHQLVVGELVAEEVKVSATAEASPDLLVEGRDAATGRARTLRLAIAELSEAMRPVIDVIISTLAAGLEDLPAQSVSDVMADGVLAIGGGCLIPGFDKRLEDAFGFSVRMGDRPFTCVAEGAARCLTLPGVLSAYGVT